MKTISISGTIGLDLAAADIRRQLDAAGGSPVEIQLSSPGGLVFDGLEIYNLIKNYSGHTTVRIIGLAASMASYIALAADKVTAEANAVYMIHNAMGVAIGNQHDMTHTAGILSGLSDILAAAYSAKTGKSIEEVRDMMDAETWLYGNEIFEAGFVDELIGRETLDKKTATAAARSKFTGSVHDRRASGRAENLTKIAACISDYKNAPNSSTAKKDAAALRASMNAFKEFEEIGLDRVAVEALHAQGMSDADIRKYATGGRPVHGRLSTKDREWLASRGLSNSDMEQYSRK